MQTIKIGIFSAGLVAMSAMAGSLDAVSNLTVNTDRSIGPTASASVSSAKFTGKNGRVSVNGDLVEARDGVLTVNGKSYGTVSESSVVQYVAREGERTLTVDGVVRKPPGQ